MLFPILFIVAGVVTVIAVIATANPEGEPAAPIALPDDMPSTPFIPSASPNSDANEIEALSRVIASEAGSGTIAEQRAIGWTERNRSRAHKKSLYDTFYPWREQKGGNPPASSARPASPSHVALAREILMADQSQDPTGGATSFYEPKLQDALAKAGALARAGHTGPKSNEPPLMIDGVPLHNVERFKHYDKDANTIRAKWFKEHDTIYALAGRFEFWGSAPLFAKRGGTVRTIVVGGAGSSSQGAYNDIPDPLALLPKYRVRG